MSALLVIFLKVRTAGLHEVIRSVLSELWRFCPEGMKVPRTSGGRMFPGTGGTLAHKLMSPASLPWGSLRLAAVGWGTSAGVQFKFRSCFSGEESEESSNINSPLEVSVLRLGENGWSPGGESSCELAALDFSSVLPSFCESCSSFSLSLSSSSSSSSS